MPKNKISVVLNPLAVEDLRAVLGPWLQSNEIGSYVICKEVDSSGAYFQMVLLFPGTPNEFEVQIHHGAVKAIIRAAELTKLGFV